MFRCVWITEFNKKGSKSSECQIDGLVIFCFLKHVRNFFSMTQNFLYKKNFPTTILTQKLPISEKSYIKKLKNSGNNVDTKCVKKS